MTLNAMSSVLRFFAALLTFALIAVNVADACVIDESPAQMALQVSAIHHATERSDVSQHGNQGTGTHCMKFKASANEELFGTRGQPVAVRYSVTAIARDGRAVDPLSRPPIT